MTPAAGPPTGPLVSPRLRHLAGAKTGPEGSNGTRSLFWGGRALPWAREESPDFELENGWNAQQYIDYLRSWSAVQRGLAPLGPRFFEAFEARLKRAWGDPEQALRVTTPLSILVARPGEFTLH